MDGKPYLHAEGGVDRQQAFVSVMSLAELREDFGNYVKDLPFELPESFERLFIVYGNGDGDAEAWLWGLNDDGVMGVDLLEYVGGKGWQVSVDGVEVFSNWEDDEDEDEDLG